MIGWWAALALAGTADLVGRPVAYVRIEGAETEESLDPLLRLRQGMPYDPADIRADLATLQRVGSFAAVEAIVDPWTLAEEQRDVPAVLVTYRVMQAPHLTRVRVEGADQIAARELVDAARVTLRVPWYAELDGPVAAWHVQSWMIEHGFPEAEVEARTVPADDGVELVLSVREGIANRVADVTFAGQVPIPERVLRRVARRAGVTPGAPMGPRAPEEAAFALRSRLAALPGPFTPRGGWVAARVTPAPRPVADGRVITFFIEPGPRLELDVDGLGWWRARERVREALVIDERVRLTRAFLDLAPTRVEEYLQRRGWLDADVTVTLDNERETKVSHLDVSVVRGARHSLTSIVTDGSTTLDPRQIALVMKQASPEVLRRRRVTDGEIARGLDAVRHLYAANGRPDAVVALVAKELGVRRLGPEGRGVPHPWDALRRATGIQLVRLHLRVEEGPLVSFVSVEIVGDAIDVDLAGAHEVAASLAGAPHSPPALHRLAQQVVAAHQAAGYLDADARIASADVASGVAVTILVEPGDPVLLRSVTTVGATRTRGDFLRREVDLALGERVSRDDLEALRARLTELQAFSAVRPDLLGDGRERDLLVTLEERAPWGFEAGGGASTDQGVRVFGRAVRRNLWGVAHRVEAYGQAGFLWNGEELTDWVPDLANPDWRAALTYVAPRFPARNQQVLVEWLLREEQQERAWRLARAGVGLVLETEVTAQTTLRTEARIERRRLSEIDVGALVDGEPWTYLIDVADPTLPSPQRTHDAFSALILHDLRDDPIQPTRGVLLSTSGTWSPSVPTSAVPDDAEIAWVGAEGRVSGYVPAGPVTLHVSGEAGASRVLGPGVLAVEDRWRLGGTGSMRGFDRDGVGPRNEVAQPDVDWPEALAPVLDHHLSSTPTRWVATGGDARLLSTIELLVPLPALGLDAWDGYAAALFTDIGNTWLLGGPPRVTSETDDVTAVYDPIVRYAFGAGLRIATPIGPLQVDIATNPDAWLARGARRDLLQGAWEEPAVRAHLSLGTLW